MPATQVPNPLLDLLGALRRRRYQVIVPALLVATVGISFAVIVPKRYRVSTRIEISDRTRVEFDVRLRNPQEIAVRREAPSAADHIRNYSRIKAVVEGNLLQWPEYARAGTEIERADFIRERVTRYLNAAPTTKDPKSGTIFIDVSYSDEDKERAAGFLQELTESWLVEMRETDRSTLITERAKLQEIVDVQAADLREKKDRYYALMELLGQDPTTVAGGERREERGDWAFRTLEQAKTDLAEIELRLGTAEFELEQARRRLEAEPPVLQRRVQTLAMGPAEQIEKKKLERAQLEDRLANLRPSNSTYKKLRPKLEELTREIEELERIEPEVGEHWEEEENPRRVEYELAVITREDQVGTLQNQRDELIATIEERGQETKARTQHHKHLEDLRNQVNEAQLLVNQTQSQWQERDKSLQMLDSSPTPWRISQPPVPASAATTPNPYLLSAFAVVAGLALGVGLAVLSEYARSCYRSVSDLASVMTVPVLGAIDTIVTRRERRRMQLSRAVAGVSTAMIVGTIGWITYLWHSSPERLPMELQDAIERLRSGLK